MSLHKLAAGLQILDDLESLAKGLEYTSAREHVVVGTAAVDLAWFGAKDLRVPLMIFEVESSASSSMANNAMKVFSQDVDHFVKPLFFFHLLLGGGPDNERITALRRTWGTYNYRVYRLNDDSEVQRLISDILGQHRRVSEAIDLRRLESALHLPSWSKVNTRDIFEVAERLVFSTNYIRDLTLLAARDPLLQPLLLGRLSDEHHSNQSYPGSYETYIGLHFSTLIEVPLLVGNGTISDEEGAGLLRKWQGRSELGLSRIGPHFGLSRDYDSFILYAAPFVYAIAAALCRNKPLSKSWIIHELGSLIDSEQTLGAPIDCVIAAQLWLLHIAASAIRDCSTQGASDAEYDLLQIYRAAQYRVTVAQTPVDVLRAPPSPSTLMDEEPSPLAIEAASDVSRLVDFPEWSDLNSGYLPDIGQSHWSAGQSELPWLDSFGLSANMLTSENWIAWPTNDIVRILHGEGFPRETSSFGTAAPR